MKNKTSPSRSLLGLVLLTVSALTSVITSFKESKAVMQGKSYNGVSFPSTGGGDTTVIAGAGARSWTASGAPFNGDDGLSATSFWGNGGTLTTEVGCSTAAGTTAAENEEICSY